jgi:hypothetical protein
MLFLGSLLSCTHVHDRQRIHFTLLPASVTGITFADSITTTRSGSTKGSIDSSRVGGGVGVGDFNRDGLPDLFFAGSQVSSRLYLNKGNCRFEDITAKAHLSTTAPCAGVTVVDINNDGWPDIYVCVSGNVPGIRRQNLLFINQHDLTFKEEAAEYGLADTSCSTQAVFFDYDHDGRPDMFLVATAPPGGVASPGATAPPGAIAPPGAATPPGAAASPGTTASPVSADKLFHNQGIPAGKDHPVFKDVSKQAGIIEAGDGLGVTIGDFNNDGWPDIYEEYVPGDLLWLNNHDGTFTNVTAAALRHQSHSGTGLDAADLDNDGLTDIVTLDRQSMTGDYGYVHNMLQLNRGTRPATPGFITSSRPGGPPIPFFSEIAQMAGLADTRRPWSVLIADFDNDGWKDVHLTNGRDPLCNSLFHNTGGLLFDDVSESAGITRTGPTQTGIATSAVYVDLDNDGDLDLVTGNVNGPACIYRNDSPPNNYLTIRLTGDSANRDAIGATIQAYTGHQTQLVSEYTVRGYLSSVDSRLHLGFGRGNVDSLKITWPDGKQQLITRPAMNSILTVNYPANASPHPASPADAADPADPTDLADPADPADRTDPNDRTDPADPASPSDPAPAPFFIDVTTQLNTAFRHKETFFADYQFQPLILQKYSQEGPFISIGDLDGDGLEDFFIGGAFKQSGKLFCQNSDGSFTGRDLVSGVKYEEDMQSVIFDANGDKHPDLLVLGGSSEFDDRSPFYQPRLYLNDGRGNLRLDSMAFSVNIHTPAKCVAVADIDGDGYSDVFIGGRVSLGTYPRSCPSFILHNDHGHFSDVTASVCPALHNAGMLNAAVFTDLDGDGRPDLVLAGDWMPIRLFHNDGKTFHEITAGSGLERLSGFWRSLLIADVDHDGYPDIVAGNLGLNNPFHIRDSQPARLRSGALVLEAKETRSGWFGNDGHGHFSFHPFPLMAQIAPVNAIVCTDVDGDSHPDLILAGNEYQAAMVTGRHDASYGLLLHGDGHGGFTPVSAAIDGLILDGDVRDLKLIHCRDRKTLLTAINDQPMRAFRLPCSTP